MKKTLQVYIAFCTLTVMFLTGCSISDNGNNYTLEQVVSIANGHAAQGTAAYANDLFICDKYGYCYIYTLPNGKFIDKFALGSMNKQEGPSQNHCNQIMFGPDKFDQNDPYPLLYVTTGYSNDHDETGAYYAKCSIERIRHNKEQGWYAEIVQTIEFNDEVNIPDDDINGTLTKMYENGKFLYISGNGYDATAGYEKVGFGWPHFYVDSAPTDETRGKLYIYSTRFRGSKSYESDNVKSYHIEDYKQDNDYIITAFYLPDLPKDEFDVAYGKTVTLYPRDIINQFETEFDTYFFQGGTMHNGRIYHAYGNGKQDETQRDAILIFDIAKQSKIAKLELHKSKLAALELECCFFYNGNLSVSAYNKNKFFPTVNIYTFHFNGSTQ